jgi:hypothetical protein
MQQVDQVKFSNTSAELATSHVKIDATLLVLPFYLKFHRFYQKVVTVSNTNVRFRAIDIYCL